MGETTGVLLGSAKAVGNVFPTAEIEARLVAELIEAVKAEAEIKEIDIPPTVAEQRAMKIAIDSLVVVDLLVAVEPILGFELKDNVVRKGGYATVDDAAAHLLPRIEKEWVKRKGRRG